MSIPSITAVLYWKSHCTKVLEAVSPLLLLGGSSCSLIYSQGMRVSHRNCNLAEGMILPHRRLTRRVCCIVATLCWLFRAEKYTYMYIKHHGRQFGLINVSMGTMLILPALIMLQSSYSIQLFQYVLPLRAYFTCISGLASGIFWCCCFRLCEGEVQCLTAGWTIDNG